MRPGRRTEAAKVLRPLGTVTDEDLRDALLPFLDATA